MLLSQMFSPSAFLSAQRGFGIFFALCDTGIKNICFSLWNTLPKYEDCVVLAQLEISKYIDQYSECCQVRVFPEYITDIQNIFLLSIIWS
jgi:hypothetical protein